MMKTFHLFVFVLMLLFAYLQWNDPDRGYWIAIYLAASVLALAAIIHTCHTCVIAWAILLIVLCIFMLVPIIPGCVTFFQNSNIREYFSEMQANKPYIEEVREFTGLLIIIFYSMITLVKTFRDNSTST